MVSGNILGEDNMFTGGEGLQQKEKARKRASSKAQKQAAASSQATANDAVIVDFVGQLRSYRALKQELSSWTSSFAVDFGRVPQMADIESQGDQASCARNDFPHPCFPSLRHPDRIFVWHIMIVIMASVQHIPCWY